MIVRILAPIKDIAQMNNLCNFFPSTYWEKSSVVESLLELCKGKIIIFTSEMSISYYGDFLVS